MTGLNTFLVCFGVMLILGIFVPIINEALDNSSYTDVGAENLESTALSSTYSQIGINILSVMFWTFGLNNWINLLILLPVRILGLMSLWYIISPAK